MDLSMDIWHSNNMKVILCKFTKDDCLNTELCSLFLFFLICIDSFHMAQNQANWFKILFSNFWKTWSNLYLCRRGPTKSVLFINSSFCLSVCLSVCLWHIFLRIYSVDSLPYILKRRQSHILENCICCLDNWVNKINLDQKQNIWHFNSGNITFVLKWSPINGYMILWKLHVWKKCGSQFIGQNVLWQSDCTIFQTLISQKLSEV